MALASALAAGCGGTAQAQDGQLVINIGGGTWQANPLYDNGCYYFGTCDLVHVGVSAEDEYYDESLWFCESPMHAYANGWEIPTTEWYYNDDPSYPAGYEGTFEPTPAIYYEITASADGCCEFDEAEPVEVAGVELDGISVSADPVGSGYHDTYATNYGALKSATTGAVAKLQASIYPNDQYAACVSFPGRPTPVWKQRTDAITT